MKLLITGGAGFIGSNLVEHFLDHPEVELVRVLDNLSTGHYRNIKEFEDNPKFEFLEGDIREPEVCRKACEGMDAISHQAALGSVPRSIDHPQATHENNVNGFLNILEAARKEGIQRILYASSSAVYGDLEDSPKVEERTGKVLSPYAASKKICEVYAEAYCKTYDMQLFGFRYFNVFGPKQDPSGPYAAVIPIFIKAALKDQPPTINGDGTITRDFTPVENVVQVNDKALFHDQTDSFHEVLNVACGQATSLNTLWDEIKANTDCSANAIHGPVRKGDILHSLADISKAKDHIGYVPKTNLEQTIGNTLEWYGDKLIKVSSPE